MYTLKTDDMRIPTYIWSEEGSIEDGAIQQIKNASNLPFAYHHVVLCPDAHQGYGAPIGGVMASENYIVPSFVGVDIGCGMCAVRLPWMEIETDTLKKIMGDIRKTIPLGFDHHKEKQDEKLMPDAIKITGGSIALPIVTREYEKALRQIGTLGGGNHFIEIQKGSDGHIWLMIHSGSRNFGLQIANFYNKRAIELNEKYFSSVNKKQELAFLPIDEAWDYIAEMNYAVEFAFANRKLMMDRIVDIFTDYGMEDEPDSMINIAHNYAKLENHFGKDVWVHRKGATLATKDTIGIIPGSMGTSSYIVKGKGNEDSFNSCSHGAGRKMGRGQAQRTLNLEDEVAKLNEKGIIHGIRDKKQLDEAPGSYKDISVVMKNQEDLVDILVELKPLAVIKG